MTGKKNKPRHAPAAVDHFWDKLERISKMLHVFRGPLRDLKREVKALDYDEMWDEERGQVPVDYDTPDLFDDELDVLHGYDPDQFLGDVVKIEEYLRDLREGLWDARKAFASIKKKIRHRESKGHDSRK